jgi:hypothetical protein
MKRTWNQNTVTILYIPDNALANEMKEIVRDWTQEGLLDSFLLVTPADIEKKKNSPLAVNAWICFNKNGEIQEFTVNVLEQLALLEFKIVRLLMLNSATSNNGGETKGDSLTDDLLAALTSALPLAAAGLQLDQQATRFVKMNLVVIPSEMDQEGRSALFNRNFTFNVLVSPEDRATPWTADGTVQVGPRFNRFIAMNAASVGGLWAGMNCSPFDSISTEHLRGGEGWLLRNYVSTVVTEGIARRTAAKVLEQIALASQDIYDSNVAIRVSGTTVIHDDSVQQWVDWMVNKVFEMENGALRFRRPPTGEPPQKLRWHEFDQITNFLKFAWDKTKVIPWWMYVFVRRLIGKKMTMVFHDEKGLAEVGISQTDPMDLRDRQLLARISQIRQQFNIASSAMQLQEHSKFNSATPKLWSSIRKLVFGMLDGSNLEEFGVPETENRVAVFARTQQVIDDPGVAIDIPEALRRNPDEKKLSWENGELRETYLKEVQNRRAELLARKDLVTRQNQLVEEDLTRLGGAK